MGDLHIWRVPLWQSEEETHDRLVELFSQLIHSKAFEDLTDAVIVNFHVHLLPRHTMQDCWRAATLSVPRTSIAHRIVQLYGVDGTLELPWRMQVQLHTGAAKEALWERLRSTIFVPPAVKRAEGAGRAIVISRLAFGRTTRIDDDNLQWSDEWTRPPTSRSFALFEDLADCLRVESPYKPALVIHLHNVQCIFRDVRDGIGRILFLLYRPAPLLLGQHAPDAPDPGDLVYGQKGSQGVALKRCRDLGDGHDRVVQYVGREVMLEFDRQDQWLAFDAASADLGLPTPLERTMAIEKAHLYSEHNLGALNECFASCGSVGLAFQLDAIVRNGTLVPTEAIEVAHQAREAMLGEKGEMEVVGAIKALADSCRPRLNMLGDSVALSTDNWRDKWHSKLISCRQICAQHAANVQTCRVYITPTTVILDGPFMGVSNRILRANPEHQDCFIRVAFADEDLSLLSSRGKEVDHAEFMAQRFAPILRSGLVVGGRHFTFLAYSMSSLREHSAWFVTPFMGNSGRIVTADSIRSAIGDLQAINRLPARYAARLSQALSGTECSVSLLPNSVIDEPDIFPPNSKEAFTEGVGRMSPALARRIHENLPFLHPDRPEDQNPLLPAVQMRIGGAKGMLSLDTRLEGEKLVIRPSMRKFVADEGRVEICRSFRQPSRLLLNRPLIQILESLGCPADVFVEIQRRALERTEAARISARAAADFVGSYAFGEPFDLDRLFTHIHNTLGLPSGHLRDPFLRRVLEICIHQGRRDLKYRARIPVRGSYTLVGIADHYGHLEEGQIYACVVDMEQKGGIRYIEGDVTISRSPTEHPGDVRVVKAVGRMPAEIHHLYEPLKNVVIFPIKGRRPLPAMLAGGDLDGDVFGLLLDPHLQAATTVPAMTIGESVGLPPKRTLFPVTTDDISGFFIDFMQKDRLGIISSLRLQWADWHDEGPLHEECIELAKLAGAAVDFRKTGQAIAPERIPLPPPKKPDFMREEGESGTSAAYYRSDKALGILYRAIELPLPPKDDSDDYDDQRLLDAVEQAAKEHGLKPDDDETHAASLLAGYAAALRRICLAQVPALTEAEAMIGRPLAPLGNRDPRRRAAANQETEASMNALVAWTANEIGKEDCGKALAVFRYARGEKRRWGARSLLWLAAVQVLDKIAKTIEVKKRTVWKAHI